MMSDAEEQSEVDVELRIQDISSTDFVSAFLALRDIPVSYTRMLIAHQGSPNGDITATDMAQAAGYKKFSAANLHYGKLGKLLASILGVDITEEYGVSMLATFEYDGQEWHWIMRPQVIQALNQIRWVLPSKATHMHAVRQ